MTDHDPLARELADRVSAATPATLPPFDDVRRRARRQRARTTLLVAATVVLVAGTAVGGWALRGSDREPSPAPPVSTPTPTETPSLPDPESAMPDPLPPPPQFPSGVVVRLSDRQVRLPADTSCWRDGDDCRRGLLLGGVEVPDLGTLDVVDFQFVKPGWTFSAVFRDADDDCPSATTVDAVPVADRFFRLGPADAAGRYQVDLFGSGPEGQVSTRFFWTTTSDGPVDPPLGTVGLFSNSGAVGTFALEVDIDDLPSLPATQDVSPSADVVITGSDGSRHTVSTPLVPQSFNCVNGRSYYYQGEFDIPFSELGGSPFDLQITVDINGTTYVGQASWRKIKGEGSMAPIAFSPPLPGSSGH